MQAGIFAKICMPADAWQEKYHTFDLTGDFSAANTVKLIMNISVKIPQAPVPCGYRFRDLQLEMSLKPFLDSSAETREGVCRELFLQWLPLCRHAESVSVMLWVGDGSEILEYAGGMDAEFEWGRYLGSANALHAEPLPDTGETGHTAIIGHIAGRDPEKRGVHLRPYLYRENPAKFTYRWLAELVATIRRVGEEITGKKIHVGETFDIGPEFAVSRFKYDWHREICGGGALFGGKFIRCDGELRGDARAYAGFPGGIPDGTSIGRFLGVQTQCLFRDCGFDFLWLSNGFGFALEPWALTGAIFDGKEFHPAAAEETAARILRFWSDFRSGAPGIPVRTRGTNLGTGIDLGSDASPWREIYRDVQGVDAPVNSPWAALDGDVGLELAGWMSHIARLPRPGFRYRYYIHDPWWNNSPYLDRYQRSPFDIFLPLAVSRISADGAVEPPSDLAFLSVDNTRGEMPVSVPTEVSAHILHAREFQPDAPAPLVWAYPWDAYHDLLAGDDKQPEIPFFGDWFVRGAIAHTIPVNTVGDMADILPLIEKKENSLAGSILLTPVLPDRFGLNEQLIARARDGACVVFYGPLADAPALREILGIACADGLEGDFELEGCALDPEAPKTLRHIPVLSAGAWQETGGSDVMAVGIQNGTQRTAAAFHEFSSGGKLGWVRGSLATSEYDPEARNAIRGPRLTELPAGQFFPGEKLLRPLLARMGLAIGVRKSSGDAVDPMLCIHRHRNAFVFSGYQPDAGASLSLGFDLGAPLFIGHHNRVDDSTTTHTGPTAWHHVCRCFVRQDDASVVECRIITAIQHGVSHRLLLSGLRNATVHYFPEPGSEESLKILRDPKFPYFLGDFAAPQFRDHPLGRIATVENVSGELLFSW
jgi:hypothetical protein